jgi:hypothetical protein
VGAVFCPCRLVLVFVMHGGAQVLTGHARQKNPPS